MTHEAKDAQFEKYALENKPAGFSIDGDERQMARRIAKEVWAAARAATLREVIEALPDEGRYDSSIHDAGDINYIEGFNAALKEIRDRLERMK